MNDVQLLHDELNWTRNNRVVFGLPVHWEQGRHYVLVTEAKHAQLFEWFTFKVANVIQRHTKIVSKIFSTTLLEIVVFKITKNKIPAAFGVSATFCEQSGTFRIRISQKRSNISKDIYVTNLTFCHLWSKNWNVWCYGKINYGGRKL